MPRRVAVTFVMGLDHAPGQAPFVEAPAPIFAVEAPAAVRAGERFSVNAWVWLDAGVPAEVLADTFKAIVDAATRTVHVTGRVKHGPGVAAARGMQRALVVGIAAAVPAGVPAGDWTVRVAEACRADGAGLSPAFEDEVPVPGAAWALRVS